MAKITGITPKVDTNLRPTIGEANKIIASDINEIVSVINFNDEATTEKGGYSGTAKDLKDAIDNAVFDGAITYQTVADLPIAPVPREGTPAKVANDSTATNNGNWSVFGGVWVQDARTITDTEDIKVEGSGLLLSDRDKTVDSLGYKIIRSDFDFTAIPVGYDNSIWEIRHFHDLLGATISLPSNVTLKFNGGKLENGTFHCNNTTFKEPNLSGLYIRDLVGNLAIKSSYENTSFIETDIATDFIDLRGTTNTINKIYIKGINFSNIRNVLYTDSTIDFIDFSDNKLNNIINGVGATSWKSNRNSILNSLIATGNRFENYGGGLNLYSLVKNSVINSNIFINGTAYGYQSAIRVGESDLPDNNADYDTFAAYRAAAKRCVVSNNIIDKYVANSPIGTRSIVNGVQVAGCSEVIITNNVFSNISKTNKDENDGHAGAVYVKAEKCLIDGNIITDCGGTEWVIMVKGGATVFKSGSRTQYPKSDKVSVTNNKIYFTDNTIPNQGGIKVFSSMTNNISNNDIVGATNIAIETPICLNTIVQNNRILKFNFSRVINLTNISQVNSEYDVTYDGLYLDSENCVVDGNFIETASVIDFVLSYSSFFSGIVFQNIQYFKNLSVTNNDINLLGDDSFPLTTICIEFALDSYSLPLVESEDINISNNNFRISNPDNRAWLVSMYDSNEGHKLNNFSIKNNTLIKADNLLRERSSINSITALRYLGKNSVIKDNDAPTGNDKELLVGNIAGSIFYEVDLSTLQEGNNFINITEIPSNTYTSVSVYYTGLNIVGSSLLNIGYSTEDETSGSTVGGVTLNDTLPDTDVLRIVKLNTVFNRNYNRNILRIVVGAGATSLSGRMSIAFKTDTILQASEVAEVATTASGTYDATQVNSIITELRDLKTKMKNAGLLLG